MASEIGFLTGQNEKIKRQDLKNDVLLKGSLGSAFWQEGSPMNEGVEVGGHENRAYVEVSGKFKHGLWSEEEWENCKGGAQ